MIKRPILFLLASYILGIVVTYYKQFQSLVLLCVLFVLLDFLALKIPYFHKKITSYDKILLLMPVFLLLGFLETYDTMQTYAIDTCFSERLDCSIQGTIEEISKSTSSSQLVLSDVAITVDSGESFPCHQVLLYTSDGCDYRIGNRVQSQGTLIKFEPASNYGQFDQANYYQIKQIDYKFYSSNLNIQSNHEDFWKNRLNQVKERLVGVYQRLLNAEDFGVIAALMLGDKEYLSEDIENLYQKGGISHVLAISGLHVSLIGLGMFKILRKIKINLTLSTLVTILFILLYGILTGFSVSTNRAVVMLILSLVARIVGKTYDTLCGIAVSAFLILSQNPLLLFSSGFQLSYGAILGIILVYKTVSTCISQNHKLLQSLLLSVSVQVMTIPIILFSYFEISLYSIFLNIVILPTMSLLVGCALIGGIIGYFVEFIGRYFMGAVHYLLWFYKTLCQLVEHLPYANLIIGKPSMLKIVIYYSLLMILLILVRFIKLQEEKILEFEKKLSENDELFLYPQSDDRNIAIKTYKYGKVESTWFNHIMLDAVKRKRAKLILRRLSFGMFGIMLCLTATLRQKKNRYLTITMLDVGQGDCIYMENELNRTFLIDGGSTTVSQVGKYRILPFLKAKGKGMLDYIIITHSDADHVNAILELIQDNYKIGTLILPKTSFIDESYKNIVKISKSYGVEVRYMELENQIQSGKLCMTCLHPSFGYIPFSVNDTSTVLSVSYDDFHMLFTGDLEDTGERQILQYVQENPVDYNVLKVAHHGSKYSTSTEFLQRTNPEYALISTGKKNTYGHPHEELLERLYDRNIATLTTMNKGSISIYVEKHNYRIQTFYDFKNIERIQKFE